MKLLRFFIHHLVRQTGSPDAFIFKKRACMCVWVCVGAPTWVTHWRVQQVHGSAAEPQAVDAVGGLFEVGHHATGGHCSTQLRPVVRFPPMLQLDGTGGRSKSLYINTHEGGHYPKRIKAKFHCKGLLYLGRGHLKYTRERWRWCRHRFEKPHLSYNSN